MRVCVCMLMHACMWLCVHTVCACHLECACVHACVCACVCVCVCANLCPNFGIFPVEKIGLLVYTRVEPANTGSAI